MTCHCLIRHATTKAERKEVAKQLEYARKLGDTNGIIIAMAMLTGRCPAREKKAG